MVRLRLLGRIEATVDGRPVELGGPKPRLALSLLLIEANRTVSTDRLVDALWDDDRPADPRAALQVKMSNLRRALDEADVTIDFANGGYLAHVDRETVDAHRFVDLVSRGASMVAVEPQRAATVLRDALALWRGRPFGDLADELALAPEVTRLEETRLRALEKRIAADLAIGDHDRVVEELQRLTNAHPLREGFWGQLMLALYRSGRQADALGAYDRASARLREEFGLDPSPALRELQAKVLRQDNSLVALTHPDEEANGGSLERSVRGYKLLEQIGPGRLGTIYRGRQPGTHQLVAVEIVDGSQADDPTFIQRFANVTERVGQLEHPHLAALLDAWREPGEACLVSQWVTGQTLQTQGGQPWEPRRVVDVVRDLAGALDHAHRHSVEVSSLSPRDIVIDDEGRTILTSLAGVVLAQDAADDDRRTDVAGLGLLAFELLTDHRPQVVRAGTSSTSPAPWPQVPPLGEIRPDLPAALGAALANALAAEPHEQFDSAEHFASALGSAIGDGNGDDVTAARVRNPYKGLQAFREADAGDYFGRQALTQRLVERLDRGSFAIVGPSGSGKSSLVRAGVIPQVRGSPWFAVTMQPGEWPMAELERALTEVAACDTTEVARALRAGDDGLLRAVDAALPDDQSQLLLFVDQFEEVFTLARREDRHAFVGRLARCLSSDREDVRVVLTIRADFYDELLLDPELGSWVADNTIALSALSAEQIEAAITEPAARVGVAVEPEVTATIVGEVAGSPGSLPLLQFTLTELFEARDGGRLTLDTYRSIGGVSGALVGRAERLHANLDDAGRQACRQIFLRLVTISDAPTETRRRVLRAELLGTGDPDVVEEVLEAFGRHRLLTFDRDPFTRMPTVEIAHEALTHEWGRLRGWIDSAREDITTHRRLRAAADEWRLNDRDPSYLLRGSRLDEIEEWTGSSALVLTDAERSYVDESVRARSEREAAERERRARERDLEHRAARRLRVIAAVSVVAAIVATSLTVLAFQQRGRARQQQELAEQQSRIAKARELAAAAESELDADPQRSILLATEAVRTTREASGTVLPEARTALHRAIVSSRLADQVSGVGGHLALSPDGELFVTEGPEDTGLIDIRDARTGESVHAFNGHGPSIGDRPPDLNWVAFGPAGDLLATAGDDGTLRIWDRVWETASDTELHVLSGDELGAVWGPSFSPDGRLVAAAWADEGVVRVFDLGTGELTLEVEGLDHPWGAAFDTDGDRLAVPLQRGGRAVVLDATTGEHLFELPDASGRAVAWSPDGRYLATTSVAGTTARIWDAEDGSLRTTLFGHDAVVSSVAWSPDATRVATGSIDGTTRVWRLAAGGAQQELKLGSAPQGVQGLAFTPDGKRLLTGEEGDEATTNVRIWDLTDDGTAEVANLPGASVGPTITDFGGNRDQVVATSTDGSIALWDLQTSSSYLEIEFDGAGPAATTDLGLSPDGDLLAVASGPRVQLWDATSGVLVSEVTFDGLVNAVAWHPDGQRLAAGDETGGVRILDRTGDTVTTLEPPANTRPPAWGAHAIEFSPDGDVLAVGGGHPNRPDSWHIELWDWSDERTARVIEPGPFTGGQLAFAPTGTTLVAAGFGPTRIFDVGSGERISELPRQGGGGVTAAAFSLDGSRLATAGADGTIRLWDPATAREMLVLRGHRGPVVSLTFSPDGSRLVSGDAVGPPPGVGQPRAAAGNNNAALARVWALDVDELLEIADREVARQLTAAECRQYLNNPDCASR